MIKEMNLCFQSLLSRYQIGLETSIRDNDFIYSRRVYLLYYDCHKKSFKRGRSDIDSPDWIKNEKTVININNNNNNKCFQYAVTVALNQENIKKDLERMTKK